MANSFVRGQQSLLNFAQSVQFQNPRVATLMHSDIQMVALDSMSAVKTQGEASAGRLRQMAVEFDIPEIQRRVLYTALEDLGYE